MLFSIFLLSISHNGPCVGDVLRPAQRVGTCFCVSKNRDKAKCGGAKRSPSRSKSGEVPTHCCTTFFIVFYSETLSSFLHNQNRQIDALQLRKAFHFYHNNS